MAVECGPTRFCMAKPKAGVSVARLGPVVWAATPELQGPVCGRCLRQVLLFLADATSWHLKHFDALKHDAGYEATIERGFRIVKNQLDIAPVHHRLPDRIRAHTFICFLALVIQCALRHRLHRSPLGLSPEELLYRLRSIQRQESPAGDRQESRLKFPLLS